VRCPACDRKILLAHPLENNPEAPCAAVIV
jgi:hypothetical protein